jgi:hypothetical protein
MTKRFLVQFGLVCLLLGSFVFIGQSVAGIMVDVLQGVLYVASGLFAFAAVMRGQESIHRYFLVFGLIYGLIFFIGVVNHGLVLRLFRTDATENFIHLLFAGSLLGMSMGQESLSRLLAGVKRTV